MGAKDLGINFDTVISPAKPLYIRKISEEKGRGVFCSEKIKKGEVVEIAPCLFFSEEEYWLIEKTDLSYFTYGIDNDWREGDLEEDEEATVAALALGNGSLYNHSEKPNIDYDFEGTEGPDGFFEIGDTIKFTALRNIPAHEELCINYGEDAANYFDDYEGEDDD